ncbi:MAG: hypothetical protein U0132_23315 [Gemmatimonadaceae bacterium]
MPVTAPPRALKARAPTRIDFGGGWTDVPPYSTDMGGCVCNVAISLYSTVTLSEQPGGSTMVSGRQADTSLAQAALTRTGVTGVKATLENDFPVSAGLGGSSAAGVAMLGALDRWCHGAPLDRAALAETSRDLEVRDLGIAGGRQDHYAASFGGALGLWFGDTTRCEPIPLSATFAKEIAERCVVAYTGESRVSADTIIGVMTAFQEDRGTVRTSLARMRELAASMIDALKAEQLDELGGLVAEHWVCQRSLHPAIPTPTIDALLADAREAGAIGGKALGASGGGCVLAIAAPGRADNVRQAMARRATLLPYHVDTAGFQWEYLT